MRERIVISLVLAAISVVLLAHAVLARMGRARLVEAASEAAVLFTYQMRERAEALLNGRGDGSLPAEWRTRPGIDAVWVADGSGKIIASDGEGVSGSLQHNVGGAGPDVRRYDSKRVALSVPVAARSAGPDAAKISGTAGCLFSPAVAADALGQWSMTWPTLLLALFSAGSIGLIWRGDRTDQACAAKAGTTDALGAKLDCPPHLEWARAVADTIGRPVIILDRYQNVCSANVAGSSLCAGFANGRHLLDIAERHPWGRAAVSLVERVSGAGGTTAHDAGDAIHMVPAVSVAKLEHDGNTAGYWLSLEV